MMRSLLRALPADPTYRRNLLSVSALLATMNIGAWLWAFIAFGGQPVLIGVGVVVYGLGLRHALDADHIAAIDNVTRKLLQDGRRSASIGLWFALGHSTVIFLATAVVVTAATSLQHVQAFTHLGHILSTAASGLFLLFVAGMNICILLAILRAIRRMRAGGRIEEEELRTLFASNGLFSRIFRPLFRCVDRPWHMALLGFLFGLSFDTASEVALFGISATHAAHRVPFAAALVYPALFAAGMSLLDTADGVIMVGAYHWALADPLRKLHYNLTITFMSIAVALFIGVIELGTLAVHWFGLTGALAASFASSTQDLDYLGVTIVGVFALAWFASLVTFRIARRTRARVQAA